MKLKEFKDLLKQVNELKFTLEDGNPVPRHFHITELGVIDKKFIDCGGTIRAEKKISLQLWVANDSKHRLLPSKMSKIIDIAEAKLGVGNDEIEVEYQSDTIGKFGLGFERGTFILTSTNTACLASSSCDSVPNKNQMKQNKVENIPACCQESSCC